MVVDMAGGSTGVRLISNMPSMRGRAPVNPRQRLRYMKRFSQQGRADLNVFLLAVTG